MTTHSIQKSPYKVPTEDGKLILEHFGWASIENPELSIAHMIAPAGWSEPFQNPEFDEYTLVMKGQKQCIINDKTIVLKAGESIKILRNTRVQYSNPYMDACEYISICTPAFKTELANREDK